MAYTAPTIKKSAQEKIQRILDDLCAEDTQATAAFVAFARVNPDKVREEDDLLFVGGFGVKQPGYIAMVRRGLGLLLNEEKKA